MLKLQKSQPGKKARIWSLAKRLQIFKVTNSVQNNIENQKFIRRAFGASLLLTFGVVYLQGLGVFHLTDRVIYSLFAATVGQLPAIFVVAIRQK